MTNFEKVLEQYEPMISASIRKLSIYRDHEQFRQVGRVALWQAWQRFDEEKGNFTPYAYRSIRGAMLDELKKETLFNEQTIPMEDTLLETVMDTNMYNREYNWSDELSDVLDSLSANEQQLILWLFIEGLPLAKCASKCNISVAGIKKRRERLLSKLKSHLQIDKLRQFTT